MARIGQSLGDIAPLHGEIAVVIKRGHLIDAPGERAVVKNDVLAVASPCGVSSIVDILHLRTAETDETDNDIVTLGQFYGIIPQCDATAWSRLACYRGIGGNSQVRFQVNIPADIKNDGSWPCL